jgi:hypothetical protein
MPTQRDRREAAEILRRIVENLPDLTPTQRAFMLGQASALDDRGSATTQRREDKPPRSAAHRGGEHDEG